MKKTFKISLILIFILLSIATCKPDEPKPDNPPENETELITTVKLIFTDSADLSTSTAVFKDEDGSGGNPPSIFDTLRFKPSRTYNSRILLLDESKSPADTISNEVAEEAEDHLFVFVPQGLNLQITISDLDKNGLPLGLLSVWRTFQTGSGAVKLTLKHQAGIKTGSADPGFTDAEVNFPCIIE